MVTLMPYVPIHGMYMSWYVYALRTYSWYVYAMVCICLTYLFMVCICHGMYMPYVHTMAYTYHE